MFIWDPCAVHPGTLNCVSKMVYELRIVLLSAFIVCMLWLLRRRRLRHRKMLEIQRLRSAIEREREVYHLGRQRRRRIRMSHTVFVVSRHYKRSALSSRQVWMKERDSSFLERAISCWHEEEFKDNF